MIHAFTVAFVILTQGMILESKGQSLVPSDQGSEAAQLPRSSFSLLVEQRRQHPSYRIFAGQLALPAITIAGETTLEVGVKLKIDVRRLDQVTLLQKESLAGEFEVPVGVIDQLWASLSNSMTSDAAHIAGKLRVTVIDYKYLMERWTQLPLSTGELTVKTDALLALQGGEIDKAWEMYVALPRPKPPARLRIAGGN